MRVLLWCHCRRVGSQRVFVSAPFVGSSELLHAHTWIKADMCERVALFLVSTQATARRSAKLKQARFYLLTLAGTAAAVSRASSSCKN